VSFLRRVFGKPRFLNQTRSLQMNQYSVMAQGGATVDPELATQRVEGAQVSAMHNLRKEAEHATMVMRRRTCRGSLAAKLESERTNTLATIVMYGTRVTVHCMQSQWFSQ